MLNILTAIARSSSYWLSLFALGVMLEAVALFYQYELEYWPCVLCIHVRIWVLAFTLIAAVAVFVRRSWPLRSLMHVLVTVIMAILVERSWNLLGVERGTIEGSCSMESGLPDWFALDAWFPAMFKVWEPCGYTPELMLGITMAEALLVLSAGLFCVSATLTLVSLLDRRGA
jgi:disulfide bond formation protein DsbB